MKKNLLILTVICLMMAGLAQAQQYFVPGSWTLAVIPDTQDLSDHPAIFNAQMQWLADHKTSLNLAMVVGVGDVTNYNNSTEWTAAQNAYGILHAANVPYILNLGNHDLGSNGSSNNRSSLINNYFNAASEGINVTTPAGTATFGGSYQSGQLNDSYSLFTANGKDYIVVSLEFGPSDGVVSWANTVLDQYSDRTAFIVTHAYLSGSSYSSPTNGKRYDWATYGTKQAWNPHTYGIASQDGVNDGQELWSDLVSQHANVAGVFSGHDLTAPWHQDSVGVNGNLVHEVFANFQNAGFNPDNSGYLRLMEFRPGGTIQVETYSPYLNNYLTDSGNMFTLIPEPCTLGLLLVGSVVAFRRRR